MKHALGCTLLLLMASAGAADAAGRCGDHPWCDTSLPLRLASLPTVAP